MGNNYSEILVEWYMCNIILILFNCTYFYEGGNHSMVNS